MTIDISPDKIERLASGDCTVDREYDKTLRALSAALTASQAETAAAYEVVAMALDAVAVNWSCGHDARTCDCQRDIEQWTFAADECRELTPADSKAALDRMIAEARADGMREAAEIANTLLIRATFGANVSALVTYSDFVGAAILAAIPKGKDHE